MMAGLHSISQMEVLYTAVGGTVIQPMMPLLYSISQMDVLYSSTRYSSTAYDSLTSLYLTDGGSIQQQEVQ